MAFKVSPDVRQAMDYIDIQTYMKYDALCQAGFLNRNVHEIPGVKFSRALGIAIGKCRRTCSVHTPTDIIYKVAADIYYNLVYIEGNIYEPEFWERLDDTIIHEVCHLTLEDSRGDQMVMMQKIHAKHGPRWMEAMRYLGVKNPKAIADADEYSERMKAFAYVCPVCQVEHKVYSKPKRGYSYICPTCKAGGVKTLIPKEKVIRRK